MTAVKRSFGFAAAGLALACLSLVGSASTHAAPTPAKAGSCHGEMYADTDYTVCTFDLATSDLRVFWRQSDGSPYRTFDALDRDLGRGGLDLAFAINGGMFQSDLSPVGLFVSAGQVQHPLNLANAPGGQPTPNFYRKPNGVFFVSGNKAGVITTDAFAKQRPKADFATQSGPMLVIDGKLHVAFIAGSSDRKRRSGVGVKDGRLISFVMSEEPVNFYDFARFFRDRLGTPNALFLDGGHAPGIFAPELARDDRPLGGGYGPIIGVVRPLP